AQSLPPVGRGEAGFAGGGTGLAQSAQGVLMMAMYSFKFPRLALVAMALATAVLGVACSSAPARPKPAELPPVASLIGTRLAWSAQVGQVPDQAVPVVAAGQLLVAGSN